MKSNTKCSRCRDRNTIAKGFCVRCYYATKRGYKTHKEQLLERNFKRGKNFILSDGNGSEWCVDKEDFEFLKNYFWNAHPHGYATTNAFKERYLHRVICPQWKKIDHIDRNPKNNRRGNLRDGSGFVNSLNRATSARSGFKGVYKIREKWQATVRGKSLGVFSTPRDAHARVMKWAKLNGVEDFYLI
jgi:hypothetical protein